MIHTIKLSERLQRVASFLEKGSYFADIGSDHAYLPCYVCNLDADARAIAGELNKGPYESALTTVKSCNLTECIQVRMGDGLAVLAPGEVKEIVIAGMGGTLIASILEQGKEKLAGVEKIIAQPNVDARSTRQWLAANGYLIIEEAILEEKGHIYEMMAAKKQTEPVMLDEKEALFGPILLQRKNTAFREKWNQEAEKLTRALNQMEKATEKNEAKYQQFKLEKNWIEEVLQN